MNKMIEGVLKERKGELKKTNEIMGNLERSLNKFTKQKIGLEYIIYELEDLLKKEAEANKPMQKSIKKGTAHKEIKK
jgi:hypothetical protein